MGEQEPEVKWVCEGCGKTLHPSELTRVGIGVHHYDRDKDTDGYGLLNCGLVKAEVAGGWLNEITTRDQARQRSRRDGERQEPG